VLEGENLRAKGCAMKITKEQLLHVAGLARLRLEAKDLERLTRQLGDILSYMDTLNRVDTRGVPPASHAVFLTNAFREDVASPAGDPEVALSNAPAKEDGEFVVPRVL